MPVLTSSDQGLVVVFSLSFLFFLSFLFLFFLYIFYEGRVSYRMYSVDQSVLIFGSQVSTSD